MQSEVRTTVNMVQGESGYHTIVHTEQSAVGVSTDRTRYIIQDHYGSNATVVYGAVFTGLDSVWWTP